MTIVRVYMSRSASAMTSSRPSQFIHRHRYPTPFTPVRIKTGFGHQEKCAPRLLPSCKRDTRPYARFPCPLVVGRHQLLQSGVAEKPPLLKKLSQPRGRKGPPKSKTSFIGHPSAMKFLRTSRV